MDVLFYFVPQSILGEFNKEQEAFIKEKESKGSGAAVPPWSGCPNEAALKEQCLALSTVICSYFIGGSTFFTILLAAIKIKIFIVINDQISACT